MSMDTRTVVAHGTKEKQTVAWSRRETGYFLYDKTKGWALYPVLEKVFLSDLDESCKSKKKLSNHPDTRVAPQWSSDIAKSVGTPGVSQDNWDHDAEAMWKKARQMGLAPAEPKPSVAGSKYDIGSDGAEKYDIEYVIKFRETHAASLKEDEKTHQPTEDSCIEAIIREMGYYFASRASINKMKARVKQKALAKEKGLKGKLNEVFLPTVYLHNRIAGTQGQSTKTKSIYDDDATWDALFAGIDRKTGKKTKKK